MGTINAPKKRDRNGLTNSERTERAEAQAAKYKACLAASIVANIALLLYALMK